MQDTLSANDIPWQLAMNVTYDGDTGNFLAAWADETYPESNGVTFERDFAYSHDANALMAAHALLERDTSLYVLLAGAEAGPRKWLFIAGTPLS